jgi:IS5 family transposase
MLSKDKIITLYCIVDDLLKALHHHEDPTCRVSDAEVITTAFVAALNHKGELEGTCQFMKDYGFIPDMLSPSRFNRRLHRLAELIMSLLFTLGEDLKAMAGAADYRMDSYPVAACDNARIRRCKRLKGEAFRGRHSAMGRYFYGVRVHIVTWQGIPVEFCIVPGRENDTNALYKLPLQVAPESCIYMDAGYTDYRAEDAAFEADCIHLMVERKSNSRRKDTVSGAFIKNRMRKAIETTISEIKSKMPRSIHAVTQQGFLLKVALFVVAFAFEKILG